MRHPLKTKISDLLYTFTRTNAFTRTFNLMEIAEAEIQATIDAVMAIGNDEAAARADRCFLACAPGKFLRYTDCVYRAHVKELLARAIVGESLVPATRAEVMIVLSEGSLIVPLNAQHAALYEELFKEIFGQYVRPENVTREPYEGATSELLQTLRQRCRKEGRSLT